MHVHCVPAVSYMLCADYQHDKSHGWLKCHHFCTTIWHEIAVTTYAEIGYYDNTQSDWLLYLLVYLGEEKYKREATWLMQSYADMNHIVNSTIRA